MACPLELASHFALLGPAEQGARRISWTSFHVAGEQWAVDLGRNEHQRLQPCRRAKHLLYGLQRALRFAHLQWMVGESAAPGSRKRTGNRGILRPPRERDEKR